MYEKTKKWSLVFRFLILSEKSREKDDQNNHTVVAPVNHWLERAIMHHNKHYYNQLQPIPHSMRANTKR